LAITELTISAVMLRSTAFRKATADFELLANAAGLLTYRFQEDMRINSLDWMATSAKLLFSNNERVTIPPARREAVEQALRTYDIFDAASFTASWSRMNRQAIANGRFGPNPEGLPFLPRFNFMPAFEVRPCWTSGLGNPPALKP
jgi:hypothetical protein